MEIEPIDRLFANTVWLNAPEKAHRFLCELMAHSREGNLCFRCEEAFDWEGFAISKDAIVRDCDRYYIHRNWVLETFILQHLERLCQTSPTFLFDDSRLQIPETLTPTQKRAIEQAIIQSVTIVCGGPGTGKTFTASQMIHQFAQALCPDRGPLRVKIAAPTGRAANRLAQMIVQSERIQCESVTLHRLLRLYPGHQHLFSLQQIDADLIVIDEASMIDASLFAHLLGSIPQGARLVLFGDANQLPAINGGGVFQTLSQKMGISLEVCHRAADTKMQNYYESARHGNGSDLQSILRPFPENVIRFVINQLEPLIFDQKPDPEELLRRFDSKRLLCPLRRGRLGVDALNRLIAEYLSAKVQEGQWWAAPILVSHNDPELELYNGMQGVLISQMRKETGNETVTFRDGRTFLLGQLPEYEKAFILSVHKSQGSEFDEVVCLLPPGSEEFSCEALYTAITRAKKTIMLMGNEKTLERMLSQRTSQENGLLERMKERFTRFCS